MKRLCILVLVMINLIILSGCNKSEKEALEGKYNIYYLDIAKDGLTVEAYTPEDEEGDIENRVIDIFNVMKTPSDSRKHKSLVTQDMVIEKLEFLDGRLTVHFTSDYERLSIADEVLFRAGFVKTVTQLEEISYVEFYVLEKPLKDTLGNMVGTMLASDFVEEIDAGRLSSWVEIDIFYGVSGKDKLAPEKITVGYGSNVSIERIIIEQLIKGPESEEYVRTVSPNLTLLSVTTKEGVCYLNFDTNLTDTSVGVTPAMTIYSIVNSLCGLPMVNMVQISINSENKLMFRDTIDISKPFERNLDIIIE